MYRCVRAVLLAGSLLQLCNSRAFGTSEIIQQFDAIASSANFVGSSVPPDPHGAVGPHGLLSSVNTGIAYFSRTNQNLLWSAPLGNTLAPGTNSFWAANAGFTGNFISDAKVVYDPDLQRFFIIMQEDASATQAFLNIAVSRNNDPKSSTGSDWFFFRPDVTDTWSFPTEGDQKIGIDFPGVAVDQQVLTVAYNGYELSQTTGLNSAQAKGARMFVFNKRLLAAGINDPPRTWFNQPPFGLPFLEDNTLTIQPVQPVGKDTVGNRVFGVELHQDYVTGDWSIRLHVINDPLGAFSYQYDDVPIDSPNGKPGGAPEPVNPSIPSTSTGVDTVGLRCLSACYQNGYVWTVYTQKGDSGNSVVHWVQILPRARAFGGTVLVADGYINPGPAVWTYAPSIGVSPFGDVCLAYTQSSATELPTIYYAFRPAGSPWDPPVKLQASTQPTQSVDASKLNRWGDYAAVAIDPVDNTFWVTHEYVNSAVGGTWQTFWAQIAGCRWPVVDFQPQPQVLAPCSPNATFTVGVRPVSIDLSNVQGQSPEVDSYVWTQNAAVIEPSARSLITSNLTAGSGGQLTILSPGYADEGFYLAKVVNTCGDKYASYSSPAPLLIQTIPTWVTLDSDVRPPYHFGQVVVFDQAHGRSVLFGGEVLRPQGGLVYGNDTWLWDGSSWTAANPNSSPPARSYHVMAYDTQRQRTVLFGGSYYESGMPAAVPLGDTWEWDGSNWQLMAAAGTNTPPPRTRATMAYDPVRHETLLMGGDLVNYQDRVTTWAWNGTNWTIRATNIVGRLSDRYLGNYDVGGNAMAFDERRGVMVLFGPFGSSADMVMEWDGETWTAINPSSVTPANQLAYQGVVDSRGYQAFYDPYRGMVACVGGGGFNNAIWYWDGQNFYAFDTQIDGVAFSGASMVGSGVAFDRARRALVWSTGDQLGTTHFTREIRFVDYPTIVQDPGPVAVEVGQTVHLRAAVTGAPPLQYAWFQNGRAVTNDARVSGANTADLKITPAAVTDSGSYELQVAGACNLRAASRLVRVSVGPLLSLTQITTGYRLSWTATNAVVQEAPTVFGIWTNRPDLTSPFVMPIEKTGSRFYRLSAPGQ